MAAAAQRRTRPTVPGPGRRLIATWPGRVLVAGLLALLPAFVQAAALAIDIGRVLSPGWRAEDIRLELVPGDDGWQMRLSMARWLAGDAPVLSLGADCEAVDPVAGRVHCADTRMDIGAPAGRTLRLSGALSFERLADGFRMSMPSARLANASGSLEVTQRGERTRVQAAFAGVEASALFAMLPADDRLAALDVGAGTVDIELTLERDAERWHAIDAALALTDLAFSSADGLRAAEGLSASLRLSLAPEAGAGRLQGSAEVQTGQLYVHPAYIDFAATPVRLSLAGSLPGTDGDIDIGRLSIAQVGVFEAAGSARLSASLEPLFLRLDVTRTPLAPLVEHWLNPFLPAQLEGGLLADGDYAAGVTWDGPERLGARLDLYDAAVGDKSGRFAVQGLSGRVQWHSRESRAITLSMDSAQLYRLQFGAARFIGEVTGAHFSLAQPLRLPLLSGALRVDSLELHDIGGADFRFTLGGEIEPLDLPALTAAFGWPEFRGRLAGSLPELRYADGVLVLGSPLQTQVFDGEIEVGNLRLADPLGVAPELHADLRVNDISLEALTEVFAFGRVTGRLEGEVDDLVLVDWQPVAFDATLGTPPDDDSKHRISQRAVNNLASLGGAGGAISAGFLRIFSEFSYDRLGLSCRLRAGVCEMGGVAPADSGYYIVIGGGLPRIDVIGYNERVDWSVLVQRLIQATRSEGPVVR